MTVTDVLFGKSAAQVRAQQARIDAEDRLMAVHPMEKTSLGFHCDAEAERAVVFLTRLRDIAATGKAKSDRNLLATILVGLAVLVKGAHLSDLAGIWHAIASAL